MSIAEVLPLVEALPHSDKFQLMQVLLTQLAWEEGVSLEMGTKPKTNEGQRMAAILQRMADRQALSHIADPVVWQRAIREDRPLPGREQATLLDSNTIIYSR